MDIQPAHLQLQTGKKLDPDSRDFLRAEIIRGRLQNLPPPAIDNSKLEGLQASDEIDDE